MTAKRAIPMTSSIKVMPRRFMLLLYLGPGDRGILVARQREAGRRAVEQVRVVNVGARLVAVGGRVDEAGTHGTGQHAISGQKRSRGVAAAAGVRVAADAPVLGDERAVNAQVVGAHQADVD